MSESIGETAALRTAIDDFMGRAQDLGLVQAVGLMGNLLVSGTMREQIDDNLVLEPRVVTVMPQRDLKGGIRSAAVLGGESLVSPIIVAGEAHQNETIDRTSPNDEGYPLPQQRLSVLKEGVETAVPVFVEPVHAEFLFKRITGRLAIGTSTFKSQLP